MHSVSPPAPRKRPAFDRWHISRGSIPTRADYTSDDSDEEYDSDSSLSDFIEQDDGPVDLRAAMVLAHATAAVPVSSDDEIDDSYDEPSAEFTDDDDVEEAGDVDDAEDVEDAGDAESVDTDVDEDAYAKAVAGAEAASSSGGGGGGGRGGIVDVDVEDSDEDEEDSDVEEDAAAGKRGFDEQRVLACIEHLRHADDRDRAPADALRPFSALAALGETAITDRTYRGHELYARARTLPFMVTHELGYSNEDDDRCDACHCQLADPVRYGPNQPEDSMAPQEVVSVIVFGAPYRVEDVCALHYTAGAIKAQRPWVHLMGAEYATVDDELPISVPRYRVHKGCAARFLKLNTGVHYRLHMALRVDDWMTNGNRRAGDTVDALFDANELRLFRKAQRLVRPFELTKEEEQARRDDGSDDD